MQASYSRLGQTAERYGVSRMTLWRWERDGLFPRRVVIGKNVVAHRCDELDAYDARIAAERRPGCRPVSVAGRSTSGQPEGGG